MSTVVSAKHLATLYRVEWKLFNRIRSNYFFVLFLPLAMLVGLRVVQEFIKTNLDDVTIGFDLGPMLICTITGLFLNFSLYSSVTSLYVVRRDELVLKRLRTGEVSDATILVAGASVYLTITLVQIVVVTAAIAVMTGTPPVAVHLAVAGVLLGLVLMLALAAATAALCRTTESATIVQMPVMLVLPLVSGTYFPLDILPEGLQNVLEIVPLTAVIDLVRAGWAGGLDAGEVAVKVVITLFWTVLLSYVAAKRFRWEPRT